MADSHPTEFASAGRATSGEVRRQVELWARREVLSVLPSAVPCALVVLNAQRQIVYANDRFRDLVHTNGELAKIEGQRPGEALKCIRANNDSGGCGTTEFCSTCGAVAAILTTQTGEADVQECRITRRDTGETLELRVWATPAEIRGESFTIFAALDVSDEKRRRALERIFLHDIHNVACGLKWCLEYLEKSDPERYDKAFDDINRLCRQLNDEIGAQRLLLTAESRELKLAADQVNAIELLQETIDLYTRHPVAQDRHLHLDPRAEDVSLVSDRVLLLRVLCNLTKNALEASPPGEIVTLSCARKGREVEFQVHNAGFMPRDVQLQVFQRSFSTKGAGRGLGTYSIKLLTEYYLQGRVSFITSRTEGTTFRVAYPLVLEV